LKVEQWRKVTSKSLLRTWKRSLQKNIRTQMAQYGQTNPTDEEVQGIVARFVKPRWSKKIIRSSGSGEIVRIV
jgi:hypothetical protein